MPSALGGCGTCALVIAAACATGGAADPDDPDGGTGPGDGSCAMVWYGDADGDGHGDPSKTMRACSQPAATTTTADDCDDANPQRFPGAPETCDGLDNDCNAATMESCPANCQAVKRPPPDAAATYLLCTSAASWDNARTTCASAMGFHLVQIDDAAENSWLRGAATTALGAVTIYIGGSDSAGEGAWRWDGSNAQFWQGRDPGTAVDNRYAAWLSGEPNDDGTEDCAEMRGDGTWNDGSCGDAQGFVCER